jgi:hypothetical protein
MKTASGECAFHAFKQMKDRYGITLDQAMQEKIHQDIQSGRAKPVKIQPGDAGCFLVKIAGCNVGVIYGISKLRILTILPPTDTRVLRGS